MDYIWIVILLILGLAMIFKPEVLWRIEHFFTVKDGKPTELYIALMRLGGMFFTIATIVILVLKLMGY